MRILTILGSPRRHGNTATVLAWMEEQLRADGHELDQVNILDHNVGGCRECMACKRGTVELCSIDDDANAIFRRMVAADVVLIASPVFCWGFPAQLKGLIDRTFCMMDFDGPRTGVPRLHRKPMALLLTAGGPEEDNADLVVRGFEQMVELLQASLIGHLCVTVGDDPVGANSPFKQQAVAFAKKISLIP